MDAASASVPSCNASSVRSLIIDGTVGDVKRRVRTEFGNDPKTADRAIIAQTEKLKGDIVDTREIDFDARQNVRTCIGQFRYENLPDPSVAMQLMIAIPQSRNICERDVEYRIERSAEQDGRIRVTWRCVR
jgi:hypothetical protein